MLTGIQRIEADWIGVGGGSAGCVLAARMCDGVKRRLELVAGGAFDAAFEHVRIDLTGSGRAAVGPHPRCPGRRGAPRRRDRRRVASDGNACAPTD